MKEVLVLCTSWAEDYWENDRIAPYPRRSLKSIQQLRNNLPIAGIGAYIKQKGRDFSSRSPCFLIVRNIDENEKGEPQFDIHFISKMEGIPSSKFLGEVGARDLFSAIPQEKVLGVLDKLSVKPPLEWKTLLEEEFLLSWQDWVGKRFQDILKPISNPDYEDKVTEIFNALGFEVEQMGYKKEGEYPDGVIYSKDFAIIYDCKNRVNYFLDTKDKRAMINYVQYAKRRIEEQRGISRVYFAFIAHSYGKVENISDIEKETSTKGLLLTSEALLYLIFKKLSLGRSFLLADFEGLISNQIVNKENVEKVYGRVG
ncbi:MAG: hypothetical protein QXJ62_07280 [Nitrososphaeria archaeon]